MKILLLSVGKPRDPELRRIHDRYAERLNPMGVRYRTDWVAEVRSGGRFSEAHAMEREAATLLDRLEAGHTVVALDRSGEIWASRELARRVEGWSARGLTLVVGGPSGLHDRVLKRADAVWSLSRLTFPHELVRVLVAEQLYRSMSILRGTPYHRER